LPEGIADSRQIGLMLLGNAHAFSLGYRGTERNDRRDFIGPVADGGTQQPNFSADWRHKRRPPKQQWTKAA